MRRVKIPSLRNARATKAHLAHIERRMERLEAMHHDALVKLGHERDEIRAAYPRLSRYDESPEPASWVTFRLRPLLAR